MGCSRWRPTVPIHIEENGWPTGPGRSEDAQLQALRDMVSTVNEFRGTFGVSDYRWFDLRDHNTSSPNFQHHYGLLRDDYSPKPAFAAYQQLVRADGSVPRLAFPTASGRAIFFARPHLLPTPRDADLPRGVALKRRTSAPEGAKECSPRREPWVSIAMQYK